MLFLAFTVAGVGPTTPSIRYGWQLLRGVYWKVTGRLVVLVLIAVAIGFGVNIFTSAISVIAWWAGIAMGILVAPVQTVVQNVGVVVVYDDLGGEIDEQVVAPTQTFDGRHG